MIKARNVDPASPMRYVDISSGNIATTAAITNQVSLGVWMFPARYPVNLSQAASAAPQASPGFARIVDVIVYQSYVGVGGTSVNINIYKNGSTILASVPVIALASGVSAVDMQGVLTLPSGAVRGAFLAANPNLFLKKGDVLSYTVGVTGTYTTAPNVGFSVVIDTSPV